MSDEESSFVILGSTPTPSMEQYVGDENNYTSMTTKDNHLENNVQNGSLKSENMMQSSTQTINNFSLLNQSIKSDYKSLSAHYENGNLKNDSFDNSFVIKDNTLMASTASGADFAEQFLMGEIPVDSLKYNIWKQFPSLCTSQSTEIDIGKLENLMSERIKLKDNLQKTNEALQEHLSTINKWQNRFKELQEQQSSEVANCNETIVQLKEELRLKIVENENLQIALTERDEFNQASKVEISRLKEEHEAKIQQFNINIGYAVGENKELTQELSAKNAVIKNMSSLIEKLEKDAASFDFVSIQRNETQSRNDKGNDLHTSLELAQIQKDFATNTSQLNAAREQNIKLMEEVTNKISTIKRLETQSSKLQHQLLSLEMIVNENSQASYANEETVGQLNDTLKKITFENADLLKLKNQYIAEIDELKDHLSAEKEHSKNAASEIQSLKSTINILDQQLNALFAEKEHSKNAVGEIQSLKSTIDVLDRQMNALKIDLNEQKLLVTDLQKENVILRSKEINTDIQMHQKDNHMAEIKEENVFLNAQLDVYKSDFEMERQARQDIANEREELLSDLKLLQRRNQQLIDEAQSRASIPKYPAPSAPTNLSSPSKPSDVRPSWTPPKHVCPVCDKAFQSLTLLQSHVQSCLDN